MAHDVFISYSFDDQEDAEYVVNTLTTKYGLSCWICTRDIAKGAKYKEKITEAIENSQVVVLIQSKSAVESDQIPKEIGIALEEDKKIIPFRIDSAKLKKELRYDLTGVEYIDATIPTKEQRIYDLAKSISDVIGKPLSIEDITASDHSVLKSSKITCSEIFSGRDELIKDIHVAFEDYTVVFLHGMGGIGKSELARQYWKKHKDIYHTAVFARYDNSLASLIADDKVFDVQGTARKTKEGNIPQTDEEYARDKIAVMKDTVDEHTLLIIDNFDVSIKDDPFFEKVVSELNCHILVTTRCEPDKKKHHVIPVGEIDDEALKELFIQYANPQKTIVEEDDPDFSELFRLTNRHTYTLELVAKFMEENDEIDYISEMIDFLKKHGFGDIEVNGYDSICKLFRFTSLDDNEKYFLRCLAMMPAAGVSQKLFKRWIDSGFSSRSRLVDLSLVKINGETRTISLHPVVREIVINELKPSYENCRSFIDRCAMVGEDYDPIMWQLPFDEKQILLQCFRCVIERVGDITDDNYLAFHNMSFMYDIVGDYSDAINLSKKLLQFTRERYGEYDPRTIKVLIKLGWKNSVSFNYDEAAKYYKEVIGWYLESPDHKLRAAHTSLITYGELFINKYQKTRSAEDINTALKYFDTFIKIRQQYLEQDSSDDKEHFEIGLAGINRAYFKLYFEIGEYDKAEYYLQQFENELQKYILNKNIDSTADSASLYRNYGELRYARGEYSAAINDLLAARRLYELYFSNKYPRIVHALERLSQCYMKLNMYREAEVSISEAVEIVRALYTDDHPLLNELIDQKHCIEEKL